MSHSHISTTGTERAWQGPCATDQAGPQEATPRASWDLDIGGLPAWFRAADTCNGCPFLNACLEQRREFFPESNPVGVIWAGVAYSETGRVLDTSGLRRLAATRRNRDQRGRPRRETVSSAA